MKTILDQLSIISVAALAPLISNWARRRADGDISATAVVIALAELWDVGRHTPHKQKIAHALVEVGHPLQVFRAIHTRAVADEDVPQVFAFVEAVSTHVQSHPDHVASANLPVMQREMAKRAMGNATLAHRYLDCLPLFPSLTHPFAVHCLAADAHNVEFVCTAAGLSPTPELMFDAICAKTNDLQRIAEFEEIKPLFSNNFITTDGFLRRVANHATAHPLLKTLAGQGGEQRVHPAHLREALSVLSVHALGEEFLPNARALLPLLDTNYAVSSFKDLQNNIEQLTQWIERSSLAQATEQFGTTRSRAKI